MKGTLWRLLLGVVPLGAALAFAPRVQDEAAFSRDVLPVLGASCGSCHGEFPAAGLDLRSYKGLMAGGVSGPAVVGGDVGSSLLVKRLRGVGGAQMPLGFKPLDEAKIKAIEAWIAGGAKEGQVYRHWSYVAPTRGAVPDSGGWGKNPVDGFVFARLAGQGLQPSPEADRRTLARRLYLDVLGVPPTVDEVEGFVGDSEPGAYERLVDRVFASPHYGERQARIWLDLARYADTQGFEADRGREMWPWRDWVIEAFNQNIPFSTFTIEQFAGDLLPGASQDQLVATGYHRNTMYNEEGGVDRGEQRWLTLVDRVANTGLVWLGTSTGCAQCHDHKYDPVSQKEFYALVAYWEDTDEPVLDLTPGVSAEKKRLGALVAKAKLTVSDKAAGADEKAVAEKSIRELEVQLAALSTATTLVMASKPEAKAETPLREKGNYLSPGETVQASVPGRLGPPTAKGPETRLDLAKWLVDRRNPLTARVQVNRMWEQHFGVGIVKTLEDFGSQGDPPSNQALLDWLAVEFMESGWDMKHMHRLIVQSATYRQSSRVGADLLERDPENRLVARGPRFRLEAEAIRDSMLATSGLLSRKVGGPSVMPSQPAGIWNSPYSGEMWTESQGSDRYRRTLYTFWKRSSPYPMAVTFDATSRESCTPRRIRTNTPLQALNMLNDPMVIEASVALAKRGMGGSDPVSAVFRAAMVREPADEERAMLSGLYLSQRARFERDKDSAARLVGRPDPGLAALTVVANVVYNLDEFLSLE